MLDIFHKLKIFFCDDDVEKIYVRDSTVIRNNEIHRMYNEILDELGDLATVVSRNYVYGKIKDRTGLSIRHISRIINHTKSDGLRLLLIVKFQTTLVLSPVPFQRTVLVNTSYQFL